MSSRGKNHLDIKPQALARHEPPHLRQMFRLERIPLLFRDPLSEPTETAVPDNIPPQRFILKVITKLLGLNFYIPQIRLSQKTATLLDLRQPLRSDRPMLVRRQDVIGSELFHEHIRHGLKRFFPETGEKDFPSGL